MMKKMFDHPAHRPVWVRSTIVTFCFGWAAVEYFNDNTGWAMVFTAIGLVSIWGFFIAFDPNDTDADTEADND